MLLKKIFTIVLFASFISISTLYAQKADQVYVTLPLSSQPYLDMGLRLTLAKMRYYALESQDFVLNLSNDGSKTLQVSGKLYALTHCGNKVYSDFDIELAPGKKTSGGGFFNEDANGLTGKVTLADCKTALIYPHPDNPKLGERDLIEKVGIEDMKVNYKQDPKPSVTTHSTPNANSGTLASSTTKSRLSDTSKASNATTQHSADRRLQAIQNTTAQNVSVYHANKDSLNASISRFGDALSKVDRTKSLEVGNTNSGVIWLMAGYHQPQFKDKSLYKNGYEGGLILSNFGDHAMFSFTGSYLYGAKLSNSDIAAIFLLPESQITEVGTYSSIGGHLDWGPYLYHTNNSALVLQASGGLAGAFFSDPAAKNNTNSLLFKEFRGGGPLLLTYGATLRFFTNNFMIGVAYSAHGPKDYTPELESRSTQGNYTTADYATRKFNVSSLSFSLGLRLL